MKVEYNGIDLSNVHTTSGTYDHVFTTPKLRWKIRARNYLRSVLVLYRAGYGVRLTRRQRNKVVISMLRAKENNR